jgi:hypothetical protein
MAEAARKGVESELRAQLWLTQQGYWVFTPPGSHCPMDLVAVHEETGETVLVDVKTAQIRVIKAGTITAKAGSVYMKRDRYGNKREYCNAVDYALQNDSHILMHGPLTAKQKALGVRVLVVLEDFVGWVEDHPLKMLDRVVKAHYIAKKEAKSSDNSTILLDQEHSVVS